MYKSFTSEQIFTAWHNILFPSRKIMQTKDWSSTGERKMMCIKLNAAAGEQHGAGGWEKQPVAVEKEFTVDVFLGWRGKDGLDGNQSGPARFLQ